MRIKKNNRHKVWKSSGGKKYLMSKKNIFLHFVNNSLKKLLSVQPDKSTDLNNPKKFLIVRQHNQLGDLLASVPLFRAIKETYPGSKITLILSPVNYPGLIKNKFIDRIFVFDKKKLFNPFYFSKFLKIIKEEYDVAIVPVTVSISFTSNFIAGLSNAKIKIGANSLNGMINESSYFFDRRIDLDWRMHPDSNVSERSLDIVRKFGITTNDFRSEISFDEDDMKAADKFIQSLKLQNELLIGFHVGAGKPPNRWSLEKYISLMKKIKEKYNAKFYLTGSSADKEEIEYIKKNQPDKSGIGFFINKKISEVAALISRSDLFISNDTGIMHVAGTTKTPQISIFGPTNPFNWAPIGNNKHFIRKSELIDDVSVQDVFELADIILGKDQDEEKIA